MKTTTTARTRIEAESESIRKSIKDIALMDYNEAFYRVMFGPEKDLQANKDRLAKMRHIYFNL